MRNLVTLLVILLCGAATLTACKVEFNRVDQLPIRGDPKFGDVKLATEIDPSSKAPITEVSVFPSDAPALYATIHVKNVHAGAEYRFEFTKGGIDAGAIVMSVPIDMHDNWVSGVIFPTEGIPTGADWQVEVFYNGKSISSATFSVEPGSSALLR